ncbi:DMT family transporter [Ferrimicrobium sp.]|uniref:DMT family transporter n=1 Tax=Ferrimicrobium sp. TaxID=2926050 RepID=UPI002618A0A6|nr:DMT family transporter [Ferrimicrobium sp.]
MLKSRHRMARLVLVSVTALWGITFSLNQVALHSMGAATLTFLRFSVASLFLVVGFGLRRSFWANLSLGELLGGLVTGALLFGGYLTQTEGQRYISASLAGFLTGLSVVLVPLLFLFLRRRPTNLQLGATVIAAVGLFLLANPEGHGRLLGVVLVLACALFFAVQLVVVEHYSSTMVAVVRFTLLQMVTVAILAAVVAVAPRGGGLFPAHASREAWATVIINGIGASALGFMAQTWSLRWLNSIEISVIYSLEPVFAAIVALVALHQVEGLQVWVGGIIIVVAMLLVSIASPNGDTTLQESST